MQVQASMEAQLRQTMDSLSAMTHEHHEEMERYYECEMEQVDRIVRGKEMQAHENLMRLTLLAESTAGESQEQHQEQAVAALQAQAIHFGLER